MPLLSLVRFFIEPKHIYKNSSYYLHMQLDEKKPERMTFCIGEADKDRLRRAAKAERLCPGAFIRREIMRTVERRGY